MTRETERKCGRPQTVPHRAMRMSTDGLYSMWSEAYDSILRMTSIPRTTSPNTTFLRSHHGADTVVTKN